MQGAFRDSVTIVSASPFTLPGRQPLSPPALVVEPILPNLLAVLSVLSAIGFDVTVAESFKDARSVMKGADRPALLFTDVKLREYNGLHLVLRARSLWPGLAAIVTSDTSDPVLQAEAERLGASFLVMPAPAEEITAAILRTVLRSPAPDLQQEPIRAPFERRRGERRTAGAAATFLRERRLADRRRDPGIALRDLAHAR